METIKDLLIFCNAARFYDYKNEGITEEINRVRNYIYTTFYKSIPNNILLTSLSVIDDIILKIIDKDIENIIDNIHDLRENIVYMLSFEKLIKDKNGELLIGNDNDN